MLIDLSCCKTKHFSRFANPLFIRTKLPTKLLWSFGFVTLLLPLIRLNYPMGDMHIPDISGAFSDI